MFTAEEATKERVDAHVAALTRERAGYEARITIVKASRPDPLDVKLLEQRLKDVDEQIKWAKGAAKKASQAADGDGDA